jgi:hypothetical protein
MMGKDNFSDDFKRVAVAQITERRYRAQNRSKVVSLVGSIDAQLKAVRAKIDGTLYPEKALERLLKLQTIGGNTRDGTQTRE